MIHMVQQFEFETDSLEDFERMLETIVHMEFRHPNGEYTKLHMKGKEPSFWGDGSEYKWTEKAILQNGGKIYSIEPCGVYGGAKQYKTLNQYVSMDEAAKEACHSEKLPPTRLWLATLSDSSCGFKKGEDHYCQSRSQMINRAVAVAQNAAKKKEEFEGLRTDEWMDGMDGSVNMGFRIAGGWDCGARVINLSLCHVYYGK